MRSGRYYSDASTEPPGHRLKEKNVVNMILIILSIVLGGMLIGIACANAVPASIATEVSLAVAFLLTVAVTFSFLEKAEHSVGGKLIAGAASRRAVSEVSSDTDTESHCSSVDDDINAGPAEPQNPLLPPSLYEASKSEPITRPDDEGLQQVPKEIQPSNREIPLAFPKMISIHERVEQEKKRLSLKGREAPGVRATAISLSFQDARDRTIRYALRSSRSKTRATYLELFVEGEKARKVKNIIVHEVKDEFTIQDGNDEFRVHPHFIERILKSLILLCKIAKVKLDCMGGSPALRNALSKLDVNQPLKKVLSSSNLSRPGLAGASSLPHHGVNGPFMIRKTVSSNILSQMDSLQ